MSVRQGNNTIAGATNYIPDLLDWKWADHILDNVSWLRGDTFSWQPGTVYVRVYSHLVSDITGKTLQTETVAGYTVSFYLADDGHKVCPADQESVVMSIFRRLGEAWYYILDTTNQRFKLPRKKDTSIKEVYNGVDGITILSNGLVIQKKPDRSGSEWFPNLNLVDTSRPVGASAASYGAAYAGERTMYFGTEWTGTEFISHARENYSGPSGTLYGATLISYATDAQISAFIGGAFHADTSEKFLYFYVGRFTQSAVAQTAGLNAELFNDKADITAVAGLVMPDWTNAVATNLQGTSPLTSTTTAYTCPSAGWIDFYASRNPSGYTLQFWINGVIRHQFPAYTQNYANMIIPVSAGDTIRFTTDGTDATWYINNCVFAPCKSS